MRTSSLRRLTVVVAILTLSLIGAIGAAAAPVVEDDPGSPAQLSTLAMAYRLVDAVLNGRDADAAAALVSQDAVIHTVYGDYVGPQGLLDYVAFIKGSYPDAHFEATNISLSDSGLTVEWTMTATRFQLDPTEEPQNINVEMPSVATITVDDGQIAGVTIGNGEVASSLPDSVGYEPRPGQPF